MTDFPVLDAARLDATNRLGRVVLHHLGNVEPYVEEVDSWISMPVRLVHDQATGFHLEVGPYSLDRADVSRLRGAIRAFEETDG